MRKRIIYFIAEIISSVLLIIRFLTLITATVLLLTTLFGVRYYAVKTGSMSPAFKVGSLCAVNTKADFTSVSIDDVIVFEIGNSMMVTHRVVRLTDDGAVTKGDANNTEDSGTVTSDNFIGKVFFNIPNVGYFIMFIHEPKGLISVLCAIAGIITASIFIDKFKRGLSEEADDIIQKGE